MWNEITKGKRGNVRTGERARVIVDRKRKTEMETTDGERKR